MFKAGFAHEKALIYGVVQCLAGVAFLVLGVVSVASGAWGFQYGCGLWCGVLALSAGIVGLAAARQKTNKTITLFMVFSAMSATAALITISIASVGIIADHSLFKELDMSSYSSALVVHSLTIVISVVTAFCGAMAAIVGCRGVCRAWYGSDDSFSSEHEMDPSPNLPNTRDFGPFLQDHVMESSSIVCGVQAEGGVMSHNRPYPLMAPGFQQIAIVPPAGSGTGLLGTPGQANTPEAVDSGGGMIIMQSTGHGHQPINQFMYILQPGAPCLQPGQVPDPSEREGDNSFNSPPPSYSTLALNLLSCSADQSALEMGNSQLSSDEHNSSGVVAPHNLSAHSHGEHCPSSATSIVLQDLWLQRLNNGQPNNVGMANQSGDSSSANNSHGRREQSLTHLNSSAETDIHEGVDRSEFREGEMSFSSEWSNSAGPVNISGGGMDCYHSSQIPAGNSHTTNEQELPLLEASPQRYGLRRDDFPRPMSDV